MKLKEVVIVAAKRTPIGKFQGMLAGVEATELGVIVVRDLMQNIDNQEVDELIFGNVCSANIGQAPARQVALKAGLPEKTITSIVNKVCASGLKATAIGAQSIMLGLNEVVITGGMENMSQVPFYLPKARTGYGYGHGIVVDGLMKDGLTNVYDQQVMGCFADATAKKYDFSREQQDAFATESYQRAQKATLEGNFKNEISKVEIKDKKGNISSLESDEEIEKVFYEKFASLKPAFGADGTVTAANASSLNDGASGLLLMSADKAEALNIKPLAKIIAFADAEQAPEWFTTTPTLAAKKCLDMAGLTAKDIDFWEVNEAFACVTMAFMKDFNLDATKVNIHGGAVALGHPLGSSGSRILVTLTHILAEKQAKYGLAAICNGGGGASAMIIERG